MNRVSTLSPRIANTWNPALLKHSRIDLHAPWLKGGILLLKVDKRKAERHKNSIDQGCGEE